jgi:hypothetical protein
LITLFPKAAAKPEELPDDPHLARLTFLARHLDDLQTIRFAGIPVALMELPLLDRASHHAQIITLAVTIALSVAWYYFSRHWFQGHYGRSWNDASMMEYSGGWTPRTVVAFTAFGVLFCWFELLAFNPAKHHLVNMWWIMGMAVWSGRIVRDRTNLSIRRTVYKFSALAYIFCVLPILLTAFAAYAHTVQLYSLSLFGTVLFAVALFDATLLHRTFAQIKGHGKESE